MDRLRGSVTSKRKFLNSIELPRIRIPATIPMISNRRAIADDHAAPAPMEREFERSRFSMLLRVRKARVTPIINDRIPRKIMTNVMARLALMILDRGRILQSHNGMLECGHCGSNPWLKVEGLYFA